MRPATQSSSDESLAIRAAWLHYAGGMTQADVAKKLGIAGVKAHRLINRANQAGAVKVTIDGEIAECVALETQIAARFGLSYCEVAPDLHEDGLPLRTLRVAGAGFLRRELDSGKACVIGFGHGRTLSEIVREMPRFNARDVQFVSLLGGLTRNYAANPYDVMHRLADKSGAPSFVLPVPFFANTAEDREVLISQRGIRQVMELAERSDLKIVGIGAARPEASQVAVGMIESAEIEDVIARGGVGEILGHFFDAEGRIVETPLSARTLSVGLDALETSL